MRGSCPLFTHRQGQPQRGVFVGTGGGGRRACDTHMPAHSVKSMGRATLLRGTGRQSRSRGVGVTGSAARLCAVGAGSVMHVRRRVTPTLPHPPMYRLGA